MKRRVWSIVLSLAIIVLLSQCVEPFELPLSAEDANLLVVEGTVNVDNGTATIKLSRTQNLRNSDDLATDPGRPLKEYGAEVFIETEGGEVLPLHEVGTGINFGSGIYKEMFKLQLAYGTPYRLRIKTANGKEYLSAFVSTQKTPQIDNVGWQVKQNGVQIVVSTHDPENSTRYYKWDYEEMYEYTAYFRSGYVYRSGEVILRPASEDIYRCWKSDPNTAIYVNTTTKLGEDVVKDFPLAFHDGNSIQFSRKYSVLVKQYGLSKAEYEYWQVLKKNTENVGSVFDAQPSLVKGNITCLSDPTEPVLGYFSARSMTTKRIFIDPLELREKHGLFYHHVPTCSTDTVQLKALPQYNRSFIIDELLPPGSGYVIATKECADCTTKGGTTTKPEYWD